MNIQSKAPRSFNWKQIAIIAVVLGVAAFQYIKSHQNADPQGGGNNNGGGTAQLDLPDQIDLDSALPNSGQSSKSQSQKQSSGPYLKKQGRKQVSPAGLVYASSRIEHVMRHSHDIPDRKDSSSHGVFDVNSEDDVFRLLDEAYKKIKSNSRGVTKDSRAQPGAQFKKEAYTINMNRRIGYLGGRKGNREGKPALSRIKLVLGNDVEVITAYPY